MTAAEIRTRMQKIRELNPHTYEQLQSYRNLAARLRRGADLEPRRRRPCSGCQRTRLTTRTSEGPLCNECLARS